MSTSKNPTPCSTGDSDVENERGEPRSPFKKEVVPDIGKPTGLKRRPVQIVNVRACSPISVLGASPTSGSRSPHGGSASSTIIDLFVGLSATEKRKTIDRLLTAHLPNIQLRSIFEQLRISLSQDFCQILPDYLILEIFSHLSAKELAIASTASKRWQVYANDESLWQLQCKQALYGKKCERLSWKRHFIESRINQTAWANGSYSIKTELVKSDQNPQSGGTRLKITCYCTTDGTLLTVDDADYVTLWTTYNNELSKAHTICPTSASDSMRNIQCAAMSKSYVVIKSQSRGVVRFSKKNMGFQPRVVLSQSDLVFSEGSEFMKFNNDSDFVLLNENCIYHVQGTNRIKVSKRETRFAPDDLSSFDICEYNCATGGWNGEITLWNFRHDYDTQIIISHTEVVYDLKFCKDFLVTAGGDAKLCVHGNLSEVNLSSSTTSQDESRTLSILFTLNLNSDIMKISVSDTYLAAATDTEVRIYRWKKILNNILESDGVISSANGSIMGSIRALEFSQAGRLIVASSQRRVTIWSCMKNRQLSVIHHNPLLVGNIFVSPRHVIIASNDRPGAISFVVYT